MVTRTADSKPSRTTMTPAAIITIAAPSTYTDVSPCVVWVCVNELSSILYCLVLTLDIKTRLTVLFYVIRDQKICGFANKNTE